MDGSTCLVVGGAGFVGSNLVARLLNDEARRVIVVDNLLSAERSNLPVDARVDFREASANDAELRRSLPGEVDYVFHLATYHGNQNSIANPTADHENNVLPTLLLAEAFQRDTRVRSFVYASAGCTVAEKVYGEAVPTGEDAPVSLHLDSPYQISKIVGEFYLNYYHARHGLPAIKARFQNVYGPGEILGAGKWRGTPATVWRNVVPTFIYRALTGAPITLDNGGGASRDFIFVEDIVDGLVACALRGMAGETYNLATGTETSIRELAEMVIALTASSSEIVLAPRRDWDRSGHRYGSTEKAARELGFVASTALSDGLAKTVAWTRANLGLIESCMKRHDGRLREASLSG